MSEDAPNAEIKEAIIDIVSPDVLPMSAKQKKKAEKVEKKAEKDKLKVEKKALSELKKNQKVYVKQTSRHSTLTHVGPTGQTYWLNRDKWYPVDEGDVNYFSKKAKFGPDWHVETRMVNKTRLAYQFRFFGSENHPESIIFPRFGHDRKDDEKRELIYVFPACDPKGNEGWVEILPEDVEKLSLKADNSSYYQFRKTILEVNK